MLWAAAPKWCINRWKFAFNVFAGSLSQESKHRMEDFGSSLIQKIKFRDSFVMFGQRGLSKGKAIEKVIMPETLSSHSKILVETSMYKAAFYVHVFFCF